MVVEWMIHIAAYGYKCEKGEEDLDCVATYLAVYNCQWIRRNSLIWVHDFLQ